MGMAFLLKMINNWTGGTSAEVSAQADQQKNLLIGHGNPDYMEVRRRGEGWTVQTATKGTPLIIEPTTTSLLELYNNGSRLFVVSDLHLYREVADAAADAVTIWACITTAKAVPTLAALVLYSMSGKAFVTPTATSEVVTAVGQTLIANGWKPYGLIPATTTATPTYGTSVPVNGKLIVPPGCSLCLGATSSNVDATSVHVGVTFDIVAATVES